MNDIRAVLFDLDNTLLDRTAAFRRFAAVFLARYCAHLESPDEWIERIVELDEDGYTAKPALFAELLELPLWRTKPDVAELLDFYEREYVQCSMLMADALEIINHVKRNYLMGLITNGRTIVQHGKIDRLGIRGLFDVIVVSEEAGIRKPDPAIFRLAANRLRVEPRQCLFVGDHPVNDIAGAADAGMSAVWIEVNQPWRPELTAQPVGRIRRLGELKALLPA